MSENEETRAQASQRHLAASEPSRVQRRPMSADAAQLFEQIVEHIPDMIFVKDAEELRFVRFNRAGERMLGAERAQLLGKNDYDLFPPEEAEFFVAKDREVLEGGKLVDIPCEPIHTRDGGERLLRTKKVPICDAQGKPIYLLGISEDITELSRMREELVRTNDALVAARLRESQKMELLGVLAGGIAHDFNNLLVGILGNASFLGDLDLADPRARDCARQIERAADQAAQLTQQMLAYSGRGCFVVEPVDVGSLVRDLASLLRASVAKTAQLCIEAKLGTWVEADAVQLRQLLMNLTANASDALKGAPGHVDVCVRRETLASSEPVEPWDSGRIDAGSHVAIEVSDTGVGMDPGTLTRIFEPFFTTRAEGHGLGLAAALGIVRSHHGAIRISSEVGVGTRIRILLPAGASPPLREVPTPGRQAKPPAAPARQRSILVVDDEEVVRSLASHALSTEHCETVCVADGRAAVDALASQPDRFDLVLLDLSMPVMSGLDCFRALRKIRADLPILLSSGYEEADAPIATGATVGFLHKPYRVAQLLEAVEGLLGAGGAD